jgi:hypothetical protein
MSKSVKGGRTPECRGSVGRALDQTMLRAALTRSASSSSARSCEVDRPCLGRPSAFSPPGAGEASLSQSAENSGAYLSICFSRSRRGAPSCPTILSRLGEKQTLCQQIQTYSIQSLALRGHAIPRGLSESPELALAFRRELSRTHDTCGMHRCNRLNIRNLVCRHATTSLARRNIQSYARVADRVMSWPP